MPLILISYDLLTPVCGHHMGMPLKMPGMAAKSLRYG
jgi:hypothetical protein